MPKAAQRKPQRAETEGAAPVESATESSDVLSTIGRDLDEMPARLAAMMQGRDQANAAAAKATTASPPPIKWSDGSATPLKPAAASDGGGSGGASSSAGPPEARPPASAAAPAAPSDESKALAEAIAQSIEAKGGGKPIARALAAGAGAIADPEQAFDVTRFGALDDEERALAERFHAACRRLGEELAAGTSAAEAALALADVVASVRQPEPLTIPTLELCTRVEGFGRINPIESKRFLPGRANQVILYTEVDHFSSEASEKGEWSTRLATKLAIFAKHDGTQVWSRDWQPVTDSSAVRRDDFFICEKVTLSEYLTIGSYILKVTVRDERSGAVAEKSLEFQMVVDPSVASR